MLANRKLFQAPPLWVDLGTHATAQYVYNVWVSDAVLVVCSNSWWPACKRLFPSDWNWIETNQVCVYATAPLWME